MSDAHVKNKVGYSFPLSICTKKLVNRNWKLVYLKSLITVEPVLRGTVLCDQPELSGRLPKSLVFSSLITIISALLSSHLY